MVPSFLATIQASGARSGERWLGFTFAFRKVPGRDIKYENMSGILFSANTERHSPLVVDEYGSSPMERQDSCSLHWYRPLLSLSNL